ncbi:transposase, partial [Shigella dysenteriae]
STLKSPSYTKSVSWQHYRVLSVQVIRSRAASRILSGRGIL